MSKLEDNLNDILGIENEPVSTDDFKAPTVRTEDKKKDDIDNDYVNSRENYYELIEKGQKAIDGILDIAKEGQHPRAYEVAGQLIGQVATVTDKLQDLQKKLKDLKEVPKNASANIKNALFVGSTAELQKMLRTDMRGDHVNDDFKSEKTIKQKNNIQDK
jgi:aspartate oxidase